MALADAWGEHPDFCPGCSFFDKVGRASAYVAGYPSMFRSRGWSATRRATSAGAVVFSSHNSEGADTPRPTDALRRLWRKTPAFDLYPPYEHIDSGRQRKLIARIAPALFENVRRLAVRQKWSSEQWLEIATRFTRNTTSRLNDQFGYIDVASSKEAMLRALAPAELLATYKLDAIGTRLDIVALAWLEGFRAYRDRLKGNGAGDTPVSVRLPGFELNLDFSRDNAIVQLKIMRFAAQSGRFDAATLDALRDAFVRHVPALESDRVYARLVAAAPFDPMVHPLLGSSLLQRRPWSELVGEFPTAPKLLRRMARLDPAKLTRAKRASTRKPLG